jgi:glycosyltransferase involved in cell wall biosynthesis
MRVLFVSAWFPHPPSNGSRLRVHHLLRALAPHHAVTLLCFADEPGIDPAAPELRALCQRVRVLPRPVFDPHAWRSRLAWLAPRPASLAATFSAEMADALREAAAGCDTVVASQIACAAYADYFEARPALFEEVELGWLSDRSGAGRQANVRARLRRAKYQHWLRRVLPRFRACTVVSEQERELLAHAVGTALPIHVLPNAVAVAEYTPGQPEPGTVIFTGSFRYAPNHEAMRWFVGEVWPRVLAARPAARLVITGADEGLPLPAAPNVARTGFVADVRPLLASSAVAVAPILRGGGTRVKILEAMASGAAVVATRKGAEGIEATPGEHLCLADDPMRFADAVLTLLADAPRRARMAAAARHLVEARYDWRVVGPRFEALVSSLAAR